MELSSEEREALKAVAEGRTWDARDVVLSDLMNKGLVKRHRRATYVPGERVLTQRGRELFESFQPSTRSRPAG